MRSISSPAATRSASTSRTTMDVSRVEKANSRPRPRASSSYNGRTEVSTALGTMHAHDARVLELPRCALVVLSGSQRGEERTIAGDVFRIGKSNENDLALGDDTVSRVHC